MQVLEQGSGEPRVSPSPLVELTTNEKGVERPGSLSSFLCGADGAAGETVMEIGIGGFECTA